MPLGTGKINWIHKITKKLIRLVNFWLGCAPLGIVLNPMIFMGIADAQDGGSFLRYSPVIFVTYLLSEFLIRRKNQFHVHYLLPMIAVLCITCYAGSNYLRTLLLTVLVGFIISPGAWVLYFLKMVISYRSPQE